MNRSFARLPREIRKRIILDLKKSADEIKDFAEIAAPKSDPIAGATHVKDSIKVTGIRRIRRQGVVNLFIAVTAGETKEDQDAALRSEFGRKPGGRSKGGGTTLHKGHDPQPFMFPAYWAVREKVRRRVSRSVTRAARAVAELGSKR